MIYSTAEGIRWRCCRRGGVSSSVRPLPGEEQLLQVRPGHALQSAPLLDGEEYGGLNISLGNDLRPFSKGCVEELTEPRLGILYWPCLAHGSPQFLLS